MVLVYDRDGGLPDQLLAIHTAENPGQAASLADHTTGAPETTTSDAYDTMHSETAFCAERS